MNHPPAKGLNHKRDLDLHGPITHHKNVVRLRPPERSQNTVLLASTQAVYKAPHSTVRHTQRVSGVGVRHTHSQSWDRHPCSSSSSSRKSQNVRLEHNTLEPVAASCTYASAINASKDIQCIRCVQT